MCWTEEDTANGTMDEKETLVKEKAPYEEVVSCGTRRNIKLTNWRSRKYSISNNIISYHSLVPILVIKEKTMRYDIVRWLHTTSGSYGRRLGENCADHGNL